MLGNPPLNERTALAAKIAAHFLVAKDHSHILSTYAKAVENALALIDEVEKQVALPHPHESAQTSSPNPKP
jgi:hypothetical protein